MPYEAIRNPNPTKIFERAWVRLCFERPYRTARATKIQRPFLENLFFRAKKVCVSFSSCPFAVRLSTKPIHLWASKKASGGNRTHNPRITNAVLCQLKLRWRSIETAQAHRMPSACYSKILDRFWFSINCGKISTGFKLKKASQPACSQCIEVRRELWREVVG